MPNDIPISAIVREALPDNPSGQRITTHFLATGKPLAVPGLQARDYVAGCETVGAWSMYAEPSIGWQPTHETLRKVILAMAAGGA